MTISENLNKFVTKNIANGAVKLKPSSKCAPGCLIGNESNCLKADPGPE
jgi:hypothetical protein